MALQGAAPLQRYRYRLKNVGGAACDSWYLACNDSCGRDKRGPNSRYVHTVRDANGWPGIWELEPQGSNRYKVKLAETCHGDAQNWYLASHNSSQGDRRGPNSHYAHTVRDAHGHGWPGIWEFQHVAGNRYRLKNVANASGSAADGWYLACHGSAGPAGDKRGPNSYYAITVKDEQNWPGEWELERASRIPRVAGTTLLIAGGQGWDHVHGKAAAQTGARAHGKTPSFLQSTLQDCRNFARLLNNEHCTIIDKPGKELRLSEVKKQIQRTMDTCSEHGNRCQIYYSGHGASDAGGWCFEDERGELEVLDFDDVMSMWAGRKHAGPAQYLYLVIDACFSGTWVDIAQSKSEASVRVLASSQWDAESYGDLTGGGQFTNELVKLSHEGRIQDIVHLDGIGESRAIQYPQSWSAFNINRRDGRATDAGPCPHSGLYAKHEKEQFARSLTPAERARQEDIKKLRKEMQEGFLVSGYLCEKGSNMKPEDALKHARSLEHCVGFTYRTGPTQMKNGRFRDDLLGEETEIWFKKVWNFSQQDPRDEKWPGEKWHYWRSFRVS